MRRHEPGIAGHKRDGLTFEGKFGLSRDDVTDRLIVPAAGPVRLWRLVFPQSHREMFARHKIGLFHRALRRGSLRDLFDRAVTHVAAPSLLAESIKRRAAGSKPLCSRFRRKEGNVTPFRVFLRDRRQSGRTGWAITGISSTA